MPRTMTDYTMQRPDRRSRDHTDLEPGARTVYEEWELPAHEKELYKACPKWLLWKVAKRLARMVVDRDYTDQLARRDRDQVALDLLEQEAHKIP